MPDYPDTAATMTTGKISNRRRAVRAGFSTDFLSAGDGVGGAAAMKL